MSIQWLLIRSWHAIQHQSDAGHTTFCGRTASAEVFEDRGIGKSCESCLRITGRLLEALAEL